MIGCTGLAARKAFPESRGIRSDMLLLHSPVLRLRRPVRVVHPHLPFSVVPHGQGLFMISANATEGGEEQRVTARSALEMLSAAYALHPALGAAQIVEMGVQACPAFPDTLPKIARRGETLYINGLCRHAFLLAPELARMAADMLLHGSHYPEVMEGTIRERWLA